MSFLNPTPEEEEAILRRAVPMVQAADALLSLKLLSLDKQLDTLLMTMRNLERDGAEVGAIAETHLDLARQKLHLQSPKGCQEFRIELLKELFKKELEA